MLRKARVNKRVREILFLLYYRTWASTEDIRSLHIPNLKYCRRVMQKLIKRNLAKCVQSPVASDKGPGLNFYALLRKGYNQLFNDFFREPATPTSIHLQHYYIINSFLTGFKVIAREHPGFQAQTMTEKELKEQNRFYDYFKKACNEHVDFAIPDFVLCLGDSENKQLFFGEADTCTETITSTNTSSKTIEKKFETFKAYRKAGVYQFFSECFDYEFSGFTYLHITTGGDDRVRKIASACKSIGCEDVLITKAELVRPQKNGLKQCASYNNLVSPVWTLAGDCSEKKYSILEC